MIIVGHRGARGLAPENTLASFEKAIEHHVDMLECDLRVTNDSAVILHHDAFITAPNGDKFNINEYSYKELLKLKPDLLSLEDYLIVYKNRKLYLEIKPDEPVSPILKVINRKKPSDYYIASFSQKILKQVQNELPQTRLIVLQRSSSILARFRSKKLNTKYIAMDQRWLWTGFIKAVARSGYILYTYTLNDPKKAKKWEKAGLYGVITDYPDLFDKKYN